MRLLFPVGIGVGVLLLSISSSINAADSLGRNNFITKLPLVVILFSSESVRSANVWIPEGPTKQQPDGSVKDEYAEVSTVFAKPEAPINEQEVLPSEQAVPWTSLKQEWELYKKYHANKKKRQESSEDSGEEEEEEEEDEEKLPQAFYGQQNADDDERDFLQKENGRFERKKKPAEDSDEDDEEEDEEGGISLDDINNDPSFDLKKLDQLSEDEKRDMIEKILAASTVSQSSSPLPHEDPQTKVPISEFIPEESKEDSGSVEEEDLQDDLPAEIKNNKKKGDDQDLQDDKKGKKKKKKKKKKKGKKGKGHGWGWKKPMVIPIPPPKGWGWDHNGLLEQLVKGSTWERVLAYYHHRNDDVKHQPSGWGWGGEKEDVDLKTKLHHGGEKLVNKMFQGSFWERAFKTYSHYKQNKPSLPAKEFSDPPLQIDW